MRRSWVALALVGVLFVAGCTSPNDGGSQVSVRYEAGSIEVEDSRPTQDLVNGTLHGRVRNTLNVSIPDAAVSLLGTQGFATTNETGAFVMEDLPPGRYVLRIDPPSQYVALEEIVQVEAGAEVRVVVTIPYRDDVPAGFRPHVHDYWDEDGTYTMYDGLLEWPDTGPAGVIDRTVWTHYSIYDQYTKLPFLFAEPEDEHRPPLVIPGTKSISITLDWDPSQVRADKLGVWHVPPDETNKGCSCRWTSTGVAAPGTEFTIDVGPEDWDSAHQSFTLWGLGIDTGLAVNDAYAENTPVIIDGPIEAKIVLTRGTDPPLDDPHPDWWESNTTISLPIKRYGGYYDTYVMHPGYIIPPGTDRLVFNVTWTNPVYMDAANVEWNMRFRTSDQNPYYTPASLLRTVDHADCGDHCRSYDIDLEPGWADGWYQQNSLWAFFMYSEDETSYYWPLITYPQYAFEVTAYKADREVS